MSTSRSKHQNPTAYQVEQQSKQHTLSQTSKDNNRSNNVNGNITSKPRDLAQAVVSNQFRKLVVPGPAKKESEDVSSKRMSKTKLIRPKRSFTDDDLVKHQKKDQLLEEFKAPQKLDFATKPKYQLDKKEESKRFSNDIVQLLDQSFGSVPYNVQQADTNQHLEIRPKFNFLQKGSSNLAYNQNKLNSSQLSQEVQIHEESKIVESKPRHVQSQVIQSQLSKKRIPVPYFPQQESSSTDTKIQQLVSLKKKKQETSDRPSNVQSQQSNRSKVHTETSSSVKCSDESQGSDNTTNSLFKICSSVDSCSQEDPRSSKSQKRAIAIRSALMLEVMRAQQELKIKLNRAEDLKLKKEQYKVENEKLQEQLQDTREVLHEKIRAKESKKRASETRLNKAIVNLNEEAIEEAFPTKMILSLMSLQFLPRWTQCMECQGICICSNVKQDYHFKYCPNMQDNKYQRFFVVKCMKFERNTIDQYLQQEQASQGSISRQVLDLDQFTYQEESSLEKPSELSKGADENLIGGIIFSSVQIIKGDNCSKLPNVLESDQEHQLSDEARQQLTQAGVIKTIEVNDDQIDDSNSENDNNEQQQQFGQSNSSKSPRQQQPQVTGNQFNDDQDDRQDGSQLCSTESAITIHQQIINQDSLWSSQIDGNKVEQQQFQVQLMHLVEIQDMGGVVTNVADQFKQALL